MDRIHDINLERIAWCCAEQGIAQDALASVVDVSAARWTDVLNAHAGLTFRQLQKLANYFGRGVLFFLEPGAVVSEQVHSLQFRTIARQKPQVSYHLKRLIEHVERQRDVFLTLNKDLDSAFWVPFQMPELPIGNILAATQCMRQWLELQDKSNNFESYRKAVEAKGILVFRTNGYSGAWRIPKTNPVVGFTLYDSVCPVIVVKKMKSDAPQVFTLMHELAHLLLHKTSRVDEQEDIECLQGQEQEANLFAGLILVPDHFLTCIRDSERPNEVAALDTWLKSQRKDWGVSTEVILRRLLNCGRLSKETYQAYRKWKSEQAGQNIKTDKKGSRGFRYREPIHIFGSRFVRTVLTALSAQHIPLSKASGYLDNLKITDLHKMEQYCAGT